MRIIAVSGGFDPIHIGHVRMIREARLIDQTAFLIVIVNNDNWLLNKKGYVFMPENERLEVVMSMKGVDGAILTDHTFNDEDRSVCRAIRRYMHKGDVFANGGDRRDTADIPEAALCLELGIEMMFNVGGEKVQSSSALVGATNGTDRPPLGHNVEAVRDAASVVEDHQGEARWANEPPTSLASLRASHRS